VIGGRVLDPTAVMAMAVGDSPYAQALLDVATQHNIPLAVPATALQAAWQAAAPEHWPWLELLAEAATVVVVPLDDDAARDAGLLAALSGHPDAHPAACHAALVGIRRGWPVVTQRPEVIQVLSGQVRTETIP
jgi:hypothetical protein